MTTPAAMTWTRRVLAGAVTVACLTAPLTGCTSSGDAAADPTPSPTATSASPSPSPTLSKEEALEQANIETAKKRVVDYIKAVNTVQNAGWKGWEDLLEFWGDPLSQEYVQKYTEWAKAGGHSTGQPIVVSQSVRDYTRDKGSESVRLDVCADYTAVKAFNDDGSEIDLSGSPRRYVTEYLVQHQQDDYWTIDEIQPHSKQTC